MKALALSILFPILALGVEEPAMESMSAELPSDQLQFFEKHIRPVLIESCYKCHSSEAEKLKGGLSLDTRQSTLMGGESGKPGITPGKPEESSLYLSMTWKNEDLQMPPKHQLPESTVALFKKWIEMGAPDPREATTPHPAGGKRIIDMDAGRQHWAFQKPVAAPLPAVKTANWSRSEIDTFILAAMEAQNLHPVRDADRPTLIRRIAFDLTGLPPTPDEVKAFVSDTSPDAVKRVIDGYLDSTRFGERWARHWLDVARYGESTGKEVNVLYPEAWRYRDYVIDSFNRDKPYDQFLKEQIAGDLLRYTDKRDQAEKITATGFLAIGSKGLNNRDRRQFTMDLVDEQIDALSQSMLGLTLACARCHDHKFDPVTQRDYYALAGIFLSSETLYGTYSQLQNNHASTLIELDPDANAKPGLAAIASSEVAILKQRVKDAEALVTEISAEVRGQDNRARETNGVSNFLRLRQARDRAETAKADLAQFREDGSPRTLAMGVLDRPRPENSPLLVRGDLKQPSTIIPRGLVEVLCAKGEPLNISEGSGRLDLAYFIASRDNPLTARVMVNRVWSKLMGTGIVPTPDNFGLMGQKPSHPELLDHLALSFMENGWSIKSLIRQIMLSRTYQMGSTHDASNFAADPDNQWRWRMNQRRLDAEAIRDAMLAVSAQINLYPVDGSPVARAGEGRQAFATFVAQTAVRPYNYRSIYLPIIRDQIPEMLNVFDFPDASLVSGERETTNVPGQSLFLMNSTEVQRAADAFAARVAQSPGTPLEQLTYAYELAFSRPPSTDELNAIRNFWGRFQEQLVGRSTKNAAEQRTKAKTGALSAFCQSLFASAEFRLLN